MARLVMKFGGTSVANVERIRNVARHVKREVDAGNEVAVVVSAMSGKTNELVAWCREAGAELRLRRIRRGRRLGRTGHRGPAGDRAQGHGPRGALLAGLADPAHHRRRAWRGAHRRHRRQEDRRGLRARPDRGRRRLSGRACADRPGDDAGARRLRHLGGGARRGAPCRPLRHLHRRRRRLHHRSARRAQGAPARQGVVRGNARNGLARRQGACRCARSKSRWCTRSSSTCGRPSTIPPIPETRHVDLRRGGYRGTAGRHRHRLLARRSADHAAQGGGQARRRRRDIRARSPKPTSTST